MDRFPASGPPPLTDQLHELRHEARRRGHAEAEEWLSEHLRKIERGVIDLEEMWGRDA